MSEILNALNWRYATQVFDQNKKISEKDLNEILEALRLAPSSFGLQPWKFIVVENPELRNKIRAVAFNQPKVIEASHLIALCSKIDVTEEYIKQYIKNTAETRNISVDSLKGFEDMMMEFRKLHNNESIKEWCKKQTYISLGILLQTAALKGIDAGPMEGFNPEKVDEILNLKKEGFTTAVLCAIGYRSSEDKTASYKKVRHQKEKIIEFRK